MKLVESLEQVHRLATQKENENWRFRGYLKGQDSSNIDRIVQRLNREISNKIDCKKCGNCCNSKLPGFNLEEIDVFCVGIKMEQEEFKEEFLVASKMLSKEYEFKIESNPCPFLVNKQCSNYHYRPKDCQSYPHLHKTGFISRTIGVIDNSFICPIVYNLLEALKNEIGFR